jgi:hypothetical protein
VDSGLAETIAAIREDFRQVFDAAARGNSLPSIDGDGHNMRLYRGDHRDGVSPYKERGHLVDVDALLDRIAAELDAHSVRLFVCTLRR